LSTFLPYGRQTIDAADIDAVRDALSDPMITQGPRIESFEQAFAETVGARHAVAFANGTAALHGTTVAAGLGAGDEVLTTPISFIASSNCALYVGARPLFADIDPKTANLNLHAAVSEGLLDRVSACVVVSLAGLPAHLELLQDARGRGVTVIEDGCHALGAIRNGQPVGGGDADMTVFSLHPVKAITSGEGGIVTTGSDDLAAWLRNFRTHGILRVEPTEDPMRGGWHYDIDTLGFNYRITDFQCALGESQLGQLERFVEARNEIAARYRELLGDVSGIRLPAEAPPGDRHAYHLFVVRFPDGARRRRQVYDHLQSAGIGAQLHYIPIPAHNLYRERGYSLDGLPEARAYWEQALSLPIFPTMQEEDVQRVVREVRQGLMQPLI
jgi:dTDP-4-amino-4,6-dideoxygalactose transaminase